MSEDPPPYQFGLAASSLRTELAAPVLSAGSVRWNHIPMTYITTKDGTQIFYKDWGPREPSRSSSTTAGRSAPTTGTTR